MKDFLKDLAEYNYFCNVKLIEAYIGSGSKLPEKSQLLFSHILNAHHIWNSRIRREIPLMMPWDDIKDGKYKEINDANFQGTLHIINESDLTQVVSYSNTKGEKFTNNVLDILYHVFNHSTYHRAQIATDAKQHGLPTITTDYIFYKRSLQLS